VRPNLRTIGDRVPAASARTLLPVLVPLGLLAAAVRWLAFTGFFGSDELTYVMYSFRLLDGDWRLDDYVGANRLGVNLPMALSGLVFGRNLFGAAFFSLACSVAEVLLAAWIAGRMAGPRAAVFAGLLIATLPTQVHFGGRIMADAPLALAITATFVLFHEAELRRWSAGYFLAGVAAGLSFWIKPVTLFVFGVLLALPLLERRFDRRWGWMVLGLAAALLVHALLHMVLAGNLWYVFDNMRQRRQSGYLEAGLASGEILAGPWIYLEYLFVRIYHTGLVGPLAAAGAAWLFWRRGGAPDGASVRLLMLWGPGLLLLLSLLPVSLNPLVLIPKQTNYMLMFLAPLCVLGGLLLARLPGAFGVPLAVLAAGVGLLFALLLQASVAVFTANSRATLEYLRTHPDETLYLMSNAYRAVRFERLVGGPDDRARTHEARVLADADRALERRVVIDAESFDWDDAPPLPRADATPACWEPVGMLRGRPAGAGPALLRALRDTLPANAPAALTQRLERLLEPRPARIYRLPAGC
jgi:4-amino-4-deoxy-L-arabinose transferase-like glycosyltransferase